MYQLFVVSLRKIMSQSPVRPSLPCSFLSPIKTLYHQIDPPLVPFSLLLRKVVPNQGVAPFDSFRYTIPPNVYNYSNTQRSWELRLLFLHRRPKEGAGSQCLENAVRFAQVTLNCCASCSSDKVKWLSAVGLNSR